MAKLNFHLIILIILITSCSTQIRQKVISKKDDYLLTNSLHLFSQNLTKNKCSHQNENISYEIFSLSNNNFAAKDISIKKLENIIKNTKLLTNQISKSINQLNSNNTVESLCLKNLKVTKTAFHILSNYLIDLHYWKAKDKKKYKGHVYNNFRISNVIKRSLLKRRPASVRSFRKKVLRRQRKIGLPLTPVEMQSLY